MMFGTRERFTYFQCGKCECLQIGEIPSDISKYYPVNYYSYFPQFSTNRLKSFLRRSMGLYAIYGKGILGRILYTFFPPEDVRDLRKLSYAHIRLDSRTLDVGCGAGAFLQKLHATGFENLLGIDLYIEKDIEYENGLKIIKKSIYDVDTKWDLVMFNHSLEHFPDQFEVLGAAQRLFADDGTCLVRIPIVSSFAWEYYGVNWVQIDAPRHFYLHSIQSLSQLAEKTGLRLDKSMTQPISSSGEVSNMQKTSR
jgi:SAM-dependent methyltransferase